MVYNISEYFASRSAVNWDVWQHYLDATCLLHPDLDKILSKTINIIFMCTWASLSMLFQVFNKSFKV